MLRFRIVCLLSLWIAMLSAAPLPGQDPVPRWNQWRGPSRDGKVGGPAWPKSLSETSLQRKWRVELPPSYSGPVVSEAAVFVTGTADESREVVVALDRQTGEEIWREEWSGSIQVPFFAASNGSWMRSTPALDGDSLYVAGMRDVLVSLNARTGQEQWRVDFVAELPAPEPAFGCVCSPLVDGQAIYLQAGASFVKLDKSTGNIVWRVLQDDGGMMGSAFSSPVIATLAGRRQILVQTREQLCGVDPESGEVLWRQAVPSFRGMNILTPVPFGDAVFTSTYQNGSWLYAVSQAGTNWEVQESWNCRAQGYMSTPVVIDGHAYLHLQNQRFTCLDLATGKQTWSSKPYGKYASLIAQGDRVLALDQRGDLLLIRANPEEFELLEERKVSEEETWAHLAVDGGQVFVRELEAISAFRWAE